MLVQLRYLFGGAEFVEASAGLTYAEYARRGFFELLAVTALVIPVILAVHWLLRDSGRRLHLTFRVLANILVALLLVVIASALERMRAYVEAFGLTQLRFYSTAFMAWLTLVVLWLCPTALRGHRKHFVAGGVVAALFVIVVLNAVNPDSQIVESNMAGSDRAFDVFYANSLSPDATPTIIANLARLSPAERCTMAQELLSRDQERDWRSWNLSRERADDVIAKNRAELERACER